jgi:hypothetical protein
MKTKTLSPPSLGLALALALACGCSGTSGTPSGSELRIVTVSGAPLYAVAGDGVPLKVVVVDGAGNAHDLPSGATVAWTSPPEVVALPSDSTAPSPLPAPGVDPTAAWISNPARHDEPEVLSRTLFVLDPGTVQDGVVTLSATVSGGSLPGEVNALLPVDPAPAGDWTRGARLYGTEGANCATCHGATGAGTPESPDGTYVIAGERYAFPAPGLNALPGNLAGDPAWNAALFAVAARVDVDNVGLSLRVPMPNWLAQPDLASGSTLTTQDLADIYAFLRTQTE